MIPRLIEMRNEMEGTVPSAVLSDIDIADNAAPDVFSSQGEPCLIHGDMWAGNIVVAQSKCKWSVSGFIDPGYSMLTWSTSWHTYKLSTQLARTSLMPTQHRRR